MKVRNTFLIFIISGLWHGANWTFIIWGILNALYFLPLLLRNKNRKNTDTIAKGKYFPSFKEFTKMGLTFSLTVLAWVFFRAENVTQAFNYLSIIFSESLFTLPHFQIMELAFSTMMLICVFSIVEWLGRENQYALENITAIKNDYLRYTFYLTIVAVIMVMGNFNENQFIYFQF